jgi:hypothetical protein
MMAIQRIQQKLQEIPGSSNIVLEWRNIKTIISQAEGESRWGEEEQKNLAYKT